MHQQKIYPTESRENDTPSTTQCSTPPGIDEYFRKTKFHHKDPQIPALSLITSCNTLPVIDDIQRSDIARQPTQYVPNFSRPFSRFNSPAVTNDSWCARMRQQEIQASSEQELADGPLRQRLAERLITKRIEVLQKEVEMVDCRNNELKRAVEILEETERGLEERMEMQEDNHDYNSDAKVD